jgi:regulator of protease activity HflC (stomatin/prohibitin superfamily)
MPSTRDLLQRFRPAGAPGAATATGVPADRIEEREAELAPVFRLLEDAVAEAARIRQDAAAEAGRRPQQARAAALASVAAARLEADSIRAQALAEAQQEATDTARTSAAAAEERAQSIGDHSRRRLAADVTEVVARVRAALAAVPDRAPP